MITDPRPGRRAVSPRSRQPREKSSTSPYFGLETARWVDKTLGLISSHPASLEDLVLVVTRSWDSIFESSLGSGFKIGTHIFPSPQILGFLLHALIPLEFQQLDPGVWRSELEKKDKDLVYVSDDSKSIEIKTSSDKKQIYGNRSYGQQNDLQGKKDKSGYYLAVNFERWKDTVGRLPRVRLIRFGWLDHTDWYSQTAASGQQASLPPVVENFQLLTIYDTGS